MSQLTSEPRPRRSDKSYAMKSGGITVVDTEIRDYLVEQSSGGY
jgi:hypothetical protein